MIVGAVKERKRAEQRVALTPGGAAQLVEDGHRVLVERGAGASSGFGDADYARGGAVMCDAEAVWEQSELVVKVKEPIPEEFGHLREGLILFTYLHLSPNLALIEALLEARVAAIAYETVEDSQGRLPLLAPMSEIAGRLATQAAAYFLQAPLGGSGVLIGGAPGVKPARVLVCGGGVVGLNAARVARGMGAEVTTLDNNLDRVRELELFFEGEVRVLTADPETLAAELDDADAVIGAVLVRGDTAPKLVTSEMLAAMKHGAVLVDVSIDQGGCFETSRPTTHEEPTFVVDRIVHYCVSNMPGAVPATSTRALTNATLPYIRRLAGQGLGALLADPGFARGLNTRDGEITCAPVRKSYDRATATPVPVS